MIKLRLRNVKNAKSIIEECEYVVKWSSETLKGNWESIFGNSNPIHLEIGMGKGKFIHEMAKNNPNINFIGVEKYESVLVRAVEKVNKDPLPNLRLLCVDALNLPDIFNHEIDCIYLNFSDPWPKTRHAKRRLTSPIFLDIYENIFVDEIMGGEKRIIQKTDNLILFASSLKNLNNYGYTFDDVSLDLASTEIPNVETEYETKFKKQGIKINYLNASKK